MKFLISFTITVIVFLLLMKWIVMPLMCWILGPHMCISD